MGPGGLGVYLDFADAIKRLGEETVKERYGNLFDMYEKITGENAYQKPMRIYPAVHYTMGGSWVDCYPDEFGARTFVVGEANFLITGPTALGASALMQGLADGYFILPYTIGALFRIKPSKRNRRRAILSSKKALDGVTALTNKLLSINGKRSVTSFHRELGKIMWEQCGMARSKESLQLALKRIPELRAEFWQNVKVTGENGELNQDLEAAGRVADFWEFRELLCRDALVRRNHAADISASNTRRPRAKRSATTSIIRLSAPESIKCPDKAPLPDRF